MKTEHEMLRSVCDKIQYEPKYNYDGESYYQYNVIGEPEGINNILIIFTPEFRDYLYDYLEMKSNGKSSYVEHSIKEIMWHLDNPVEYIYNLIFKR